MLLPIGTDSVVTVAGTTSYGDGAFCVATIDESNKQVDKRKNDEMTIDRSIGHRCVVYTKS